LSDENVDFLSLDGVHELKRVVDDGNLEVRRLQYSYNLDADDSETASLELARREATRGNGIQKLFPRITARGITTPIPLNSYQRILLGSMGGIKISMAMLGILPSIIPTPLV